MKTLTLSVHDIVDTLLRSGDIDNRAYNQETMEEGTLLHKIYQSKQGPSYLSEYFLSCEIVRGNFTLKISGRADGIIVQNKRIIIDEIKTTNQDLKKFKTDNEEWPYFTRCHHIDNHSITYGNNHTTTDCHTSCQPFWHCF